MDRYASRNSNLPDAPLDGLCTACRQTSAVPRHALSPEYPPDRIMVSKLATPKRWDMIVHRVDANTNYIQRIIALPGETVFLQDGRIYSNNAPLTPPAELQRVPYEPGKAGFGAERFGDPDAPTTLAADEFFLVGDNIEASFDSRYRGPVKRDAIIGVLELTYWPPSRFRIFR